MTPRQQVLTLARERIEGREDCFICHALNHAAEGRPTLAEAARILKEEIDYALDGSGSLSSWLLHQMQDLTGLPRPQPYHHDWLHESGVATLARLAWIDKLLETA